ncbi:HEAT repeat domain-containing protein [Cystobacter fuscus]|uniref:nSTAND1 domain-containing NTPase n=1 Tax=Cystobacter fuscus TaxID=43 RepID=UPI002B2CC1E6|nr:HEAT repeat domain-containing protein [Cystobacter fuscus]
MRPERAPGPTEGTATPPYKFLNYFEEEDQASFAGREDEVQEALAGLTRGRTYVVYSRSGLGKTSLLLAGLFPRLRQRGFHPVRVRLLESPVEDFCAALAAEFQRPELALVKEPAERQERVPHLLEELSARWPLVIVLDQFEEFFVRFRDRPAARADLVALLGNIYQEHATNIRLVFSLREDYYAELEDLRAELPELTRYGLRLLPLTAYGARQAIVRPLQHSHLTYEESFVNRLVDLLADWNFDPPVLQIVCTELYRDVVTRRGLPVHLTREDLERLGGVDGILRGYVHRVTSGLAAERMLLVRVVLDALISSERTRYALRAEDLLTGPVRANYTELRAVLDHLTEQGLLRVEQRQGERWYELLHEHLMSIVESWLSTDVDYVHFRTTYNLVATLSEDTQWRSNPRWLLTAPQLAERVAPWKDRLRLDETQAEFLLRSGLHGEADSVADWSARFDEFGEDRSVKLVLELLDHPEPPVRRGAAASCGRLRDPSGQLAGRCLTLALTDKEEVVRRAARKSFVALAGSRQLAMLRDALGGPEQRAFALELLADLLEAGRSPEGIPERWLRHAQALVRARRIEREQPTIRMRMMTGAQVGTLAGLLWVLLIGLPTGAYWLCTTHPEQVSVRWPDVFLSRMLWLLIDNAPFVFFPWSLILGMSVARRAAITAAARGREDWNAVVLRSGTLMFSCVLLHLVLVMTTEVTNIQEEEAELARQLGLLRGSVFLGVLVVTSFVAWLLTVGLVRLGSRCITSGTNSSSMLLIAALCSLVFPYTLDMFLSMGGWWMGIQPGALQSLWASSLELAAVTANYQAFIILTVLATERSRRPQAPRSTTLRARVTVLLGTLAFTIVFFTVHEAGTFLGMGRKYQLVRETPIAGRVWQNQRDVEYFSLEVASNGPFAISIHEGDSARSRLILSGKELTNGTLLLSGWSHLTGAIASRPALDKPTGPPRPPLRMDYHYLLRREPILQGGQASCTRTGGH